MKRLEIQQPIVRLDSISVGMADATRLHETSLEVPAGFTLVFGPSGSGKSTLASVISGHLRPTTGSAAHLDTNGEVVFRNEAAAKDRLHRRFGRVVYNALMLETREDRRFSRYVSDNIGFIAQLPHIPNDITAKQYLTLGHKIRGTEIDPVYLDGLLDNLQIRDQLDKQASEMSGGQLQRIALAYALAHEPRIIIADEPTSSMDSVSGELAMNELRARADEGASVICISHMKTHQAYADNLISVEDGRVNLNS
jgi:putative ABC transport system ATP-binding protein